MAYNIPAVTDIFLRAQKNVVTQNTTKALASAGVLRSLAAYWRRTVTVL